MIKAFQHVACSRRLVSKRPVGRLSALQQVSISGLYRNPGGPADMLRRQPKRTALLTGSYSIPYRDRLEPFLGLSDFDEAVPWLVVEDDGGVA
jgi:hypothetical protein